MVRQLKIALAVLRLKQVEARTGLKKSSIYKKSAEGTFPSQVKLGVRAVGWIESEIDEWIAAQIENSRTVPGGAAVMAGERRRPVAKNGAASKVLASKMLPQLDHPPKHHSPPQFAESDTSLDSNTASAEKREARDE